MPPYEQVCLQTSWVRHIYIDKIMYAVNNEVSVSINLLDGYTKEYILSLAKGKISHSTFTYGHIV